jgi:hypothetical protein
MASVFITWLDIEVTFVVVGCFKVLTIPTRTHLASGLRCPLNMLGCARGIGQPCGRRSATRWENDQILQRSEAISRPGTSDRGTTRTRITDLSDFHLLTVLTSSMHILALFFPPSPGSTPHIGWLRRAACRFVLPSNTYNHHPRQLV